MAAAHRGARSPGTDADQRTGRERRRRSRVQRLAAGTRQRHPRRLAAARHTAPRYAVHPCAPLAGDPHRAAREDIIFPTKAESMNVSSFRRTLQSRDS